MGTLYVGWEDGNLLLNGADTYVQTTRAITITGYPTEFLSNLVFSNMGAMVLLQLAGLPTKPSFGGAPSYYLNVPSNPDFTSNTPYNPNASQLGGGIGGSGVFAAFILKSGLGASANQIVSSPPGLSLPVPAGGYIVAHMDGGGSGTRVTDAEVQGTLICYV